MALPSTATREVPHEVIPCDQLPPAVYRDLPEAPTTWTKLIGPSVLLLGLWPAPLVEVMGKEPGDEALATAAVPRIDTTPVVDRLAALPVWAWGALIGVAALIFWVGRQSGPQEPPPTPTPTAEEITAQRAEPIGKMIDISRIEPNPHQPRKEFGELSELGACQMAKRFTITGDHLPSRRSARARVREAQAGTQGNRG